MISFNDVFFSGCILERCMTVLSMVFQALPDETVADSVEQSQMTSQEMLIALLFTLLALLSMLSAFFFFQFSKSRRLRVQNKKEIEEQQRSNETIMQILEQKKREIEQQSFELQERDTELKWQSENALRLYDEVEMQKKELTDSIEYAKKIQTILLPETNFINEILNDYFVLFRPRDIVSGDFYWVSAKKEKTLVAVADCTGHGVPGAFMSILGINFMNTVVQNEYLHADIILNQMREQVINALRQTGKDLENKDGMDMALCIIDWENARIEYAGANIPLTLLRSSPSSPRELIEVKPDRMPIGIYEHIERPFTRHTLPIIPGDSIYMYTDGYCDQFGGTELKKFKKKNLIKLLLKIHTLNMTEQKKRLEQNLEQWQGDLPQVDDILMLGIKI